jgi:hypothetical protein
MASVSTHWMPKILAANKFIDIITEGERNWIFLFPLNTFAKIITNKNSGLHWQNYSCITVSLQKEFFISNFNAVVNT